MNTKIDLDEVLRALQEEITRVENQVEIACNRKFKSDHPLTKRERWSKYLEDLKGKAAELILLGAVPDGEDEDD